MILTSNFRPRDNEIEQAVKELLHNSRWLDSSDISVAVNDGEVTLLGTVKSQDERDYALSIVELVSGVVSITSQLIVKINDGILPTDIGRHS